MKGIWVFLICLLNGWVASGQISDHLRSKILKLAHSSTSDGKVILDRVGDFKFEQYVDGYKMEDILSAFGLAVHESCHMLSYRMAAEYWDRGDGHYNVYFINDSIQIVVRHGYLYNSHLLNSVVPDSLETQIFRYKTYIGKPSDLSSQEHGIYGLLDEFAAYYHDTKANLELFPYYAKERSPNFRSVTEWSNYIEQVAKAYYAYFEFKLFMSWYLQFAKDEYPDVYNSCMNNKNLRLAYTLLDDLFIDVIKEYKTKLKLVIKKLNDAGLRVEEMRLEDDTYLMVVEDTTASGISLNLSKEELLILLLSMPEHQIIKNFRLKGVNINNCKKFMDNM